MNMPAGSTARKLVGFFFAVGASILAFFLREALVAFLGPMPPYVTAYPAVMIVALVGGTWPGIAATLICGFLGGASDMPRLVLFLFMGVCISVVSGLYIKSRHRAIDYHKQVATLEGERKWRKLAESMPNLVWTCNPRGWCEYISSQWADYTGIPAEEQTGIGWTKQIHPEDLDRLRAAWKGSMDSGELFDIEFRIRRNDGEWRWFKNRALPVRDEDGRIIEWYGSSTDIEDIKSAEETSRKLYRTLLALNNTNQAILHAEDEPGFLQEVCRIIVEDCGHAMVWIGYAEQDEARSVRPVAHCGFEEGYLETLNLTWADTERGRGPTGTAIRTGKPGMCRDMAQDPDFAPWREEAHKRGYRSSVVLPLLERGRAFGAITIYSRQPDAFSEDEVGLLTGLARELSFGIMSLRARADHAQAQEELRKSNRMLEYAPVLVRNLEDEITLWNKGMENLYGFSAGEALGKVSHELLKTQEPAPTSAVIIEKGQWEGEIEHRHKNGKDMTVLSQQIVYRDADGRPAAIIEINREITRRKKLEEDLRLSEEKFARAFSGNPSAIVMSRLEDGVILEANDTWLELNGYSRDEAVGRSARALIWPSAEASTQFIEELKKRGSIRNREQDFHKKSGEAYTAQLSAQILQMRAEHVIIATLVDITERKRTDQALAVKTAQLESSLNDLESFSYTISHDLRAPLRAIDGFSRMLLRDIGGKLDPESMRKFNVINSNALKMAQLIEDLLSYSRTGRAALSKARVDMRSLVAEVWREIRDGNPDRKMEIRIKELPAAYGDRVLLRQVLSNLLGNAVKFTRAREQAIIEVAGSRNGESSVTYSVSDNGAGFDMQYYDKIFEIFRRLHSDREFEGTGIGLAIVKKIIEKHGGAIRAEGRPGEGAVFRFTLPAK